MSVCGGPLWGRGGITKIDPCDLDHFLFHTSPEEKEHMMHFMVETLYVALRNEQGKRSRFELGD